MKGAAQRAPVVGAARGQPPGARKRAWEPGALASGVSAVPSRPWRFLATPSLPPQASGRPHACAHALVPAKQPASRRFTPARGGPIG